MIAGSFLRGTPPPQGILGQFWDPVLRIGPESWFSATWTQVKLLFTRSRVSQGSRPSWTSVSCLKNPMIEFPVCPVPVTKLRNGNLVMVMVITKITILIIFPAILPVSIPTLTLPLTTVPRISPTENRELFSVAASSLLSYSAATPLLSRVLHSPHQCISQCFREGVFWTLKGGCVNGIWRFYILLPYVFGVFLVHHSKELHEYWLIYSGPPLSQDFCQPLNPSQWLQWVHQF